MSTDSMCVLKKSQKKRTWYETKKRESKSKKKTLWKFPWTSVLRAVPRSSIQFQECFRPDLIVRLSVDSAMKPTS